MSFFFNTNFEQSKEMERWIFYLSKKVKITKRNGKLRCTYIDKEFIIFI